MGITGRVFPVCRMAGCRSPPSRRRLLWVYEFEIENSWKREKLRSIENTPRKAQQPGDRDHLDTARDETRPTRVPALARFHRSRVCGNRARTALAVSKND